MRVHLRGIVLGVAVLLSVVVVISIFNALDAPSEGRRGRSRLTVSSGEVEEEDQEEQEEEEAGLSPRWRNHAPIARNRHGC